MTLASSPNAQKLMFRLMTEKPTLAATRKFFSAGSQLKFTALQQDVCTGLTAEVHRVATFRQLTI
jgi:hypothetical protein